MDLVGGSIAVVRDAEITDDALAAFFASKMKSIAWPTV